MKNTDHALVPKLRFPEFSDSEGWQEVTIQKIAAVNAGQSPSSVYYNETGDGTPFYQGKTDFGEVFINNPTKWTKQVTSLALANDILISVRAPVGALNISIQEICIGRGLAGLKAKDNHLFLYYLLLRVNRLFVGNGGSVFDSITKSQIENTKIPYTLIATEQQKIADCLSSLDDLITAENRKLETLRTYKKGLMQHLFPQPGHTQPRLRFPKFRDKGEWEEEVLDKVFHLQDGFAFKSTDLTESSENATQLVRITEINNKNKNENKIYVPNELLEPIIMKQYLVNNGDLLLSLTGAAGFNFFIWDGGQAVINQRTLKIKAKKKSDLNLTYLLEPLIYSRINNRGEGQNNNLSKEFLSKLTILKPQSSEQQFIANCLISLDVQIIAHSQKTEALKQHKVGLMRQLFPVWEE